MSGNEYGKSNKATDCQEVPPERCHWSPDAVQTGGAGRTAAARVMVEPPTLRYRPPTQAGEASRWVHEATGGTQTPLRTKDLSTIKSQKHRNVVHHQCFLRFSAQGARRVIVALTASRQP